MKKKDTIFNNPCNIYTFLWCFYYLQGVLNEQDSFLSKVILGLLLVLSFYHLILLMKFRLPYFFKGTLLLLGMIAIYGFYRVTMESRAYAHDPFLFVKNVCISLLPVFSYYYYTLTGALKETNIKSYALIFLGVSVLSFFYEQQVRISRTVTDRTEFVVNKAYYFVSLLPFVFAFYKRKIVQYLLLAIILLMILSAMKRGALVCGAAFLVYFLAKSLKTSSGFKNVVVIVLSVVLIIVIVQYFEYLFQTSDYFVQRFDSTMEGDASDRESMYPMYFRYFINQSSPFFLLFGNGINGTDFIFGVGAHNDWLEIAIDFGILGLIIYIYYLVSFYKSGKQICGDTNAKLMIISVFMLDFLKTLFSFSFNNRPVFESCALGYALCIGYMAYLNQKNLKMSK